LVHSFSFGYPLKIPDSCGSGSLNLNINMSLSCPSDWTLHGSSCYYLPPGTATWIAAQDACAVLGSYLVRVDSAEENGFLYDTYHTASAGQVWSCLNDRDVEGSFQCSQGTSLYRNFALNEPNDANNNEDCVTLFYSTSNWNDWACTNAYRYICERDASLLSGSIAPSSAPTLQAWSCGTVGNTDPWRSGEVLFGSSCYYLSSTTATWSAAKDACAALGSSLVRVDSVEENIFLYNNYHTVGNIWSCLNDRDVEGSFQCSQGTSLYRNFLFSQPDDYNGDEDCVTLFFSSSIWNDGPCTNAYRYICERDASRISGFIAPSSAPTLQAWSCGAGDKLFGSSCYYLSSGTATWSAAQDACASRGSSLVRVDSAEENIFLYNNYFPFGNIWSCLNDISVEGSFQCSQGTSLYHNFALVAPNNNGDEDCVALFFASTSNWNDWGCTNTFRYICERPAVWSPTPLPTTSPTNVPTKSPTPIPSIQPTISPTTGPSIAPTLSPTRSPTAIPSMQPTTHFLSLPVSFDIDESNDSEGFKI
jgi:hypothetical protein